MADLVKAEPTSLERWEEENPKPPSWHLIFFVFFTVMMIHSIFIHATTGAAPWVSYAVDSLMMVLNFPKAVDRVSWSLQRRQVIKALAPPDDPARRLEILEAQSAELDLHISRLEKDDQ